MSITSILCFAYMYFNKVPYAPFGKREVRGLLVARGVGGFFGVTGLYYSLVYLPIAEATVLSFLAPMVAGFACSFLINEPFPRLEQIAALFSIGGVGLIAVDSPSPESAKNGTANIASRAQSSDVSSSHRLGAICMAMVGVLGAASAYTTIRWIGKRAHPLISVNYFAVWCTIVSTTALLAVPDIGFKLPSNAIEWTYFVGMGISGFVMQFLLTAGLQFEKSSRANNMVYTLMFFALAADKVIWGTTPSLVSVTGSGLILGSAVYVAVKKDAPKTGKNREQRGDDEEEAAFLVQNSEDQEQTEVLELHSAAVRQSEPQRP
ncbi:MAG: hypothetical protein M1814_004671 [Vezdaea aestivalis]|nr:MAG: hypothetical protein M1814_004671 [Vezdaea aestivalis]